MRNSLFAVIHIIHISMILPICISLMAKKLNENTMNEYMLTCIYVHLLFEITLRNLIALFIIYCVYNILHIAICNTFTFNYALKLRLVFW